MILGGMEAQPQKTAVPVRPARDEGSRAWDSRGRQESNTFPLETSVECPNAQRLDSLNAFRNTDPSSVPLFAPTYGSLRLLVQSAFRGLAQRMLARTIVSIVLSVP
jgi:hypothetical protein